MFPRHGQDSGALFSVATPRIRQLVEGWLRVRLSAIYAVLRVQMKLLMAPGAERNQIVICVVAEPAAKANVVNLKILRGPTMLASPAVTLQYLRANSMICCRIQP
jgi:hypothetical protein